MPSTSIPSIALPLGDAHILELSAGWDLESVGEKQIHLFHIDSDAVSG